MAKTKRFFEDPEKTAFFMDLKEHPENGIFAKPEIRTKPRNNEVVVRTDLNGREVIVRAGRCAGKTGVIIGPAREQREVYAVYCVKVKGRLQFLPEEDFQVLEDPPEETEKE